MNDVQNPETITEGNIYNKILRLLRAEGYKIERNE